MSSVCRTLAGGVIKITKLVSLTWIFCSLVASLAFPVFVCVWELFPCSYRRLTCFCRNLFVFAFGLKLQDHFRVLASFFLRLDVGPRPPGHCWLRGSVVACERSALVSDRLHHCYSWLPVWNFGSCRLLSSSYYVKRERGAVISFLKSPASCHYCYNLSITAPALPCLDSRHFNS